jgi:cytochrome c peroxidase
VSYSAFNPDGPPHFSPIIELFVGGQFWDGHAVDLADQATFPFLNANEMNNLNGVTPAPEMVVQKVAQGPLAAGFRAVYGQDVFSGPTDAAYHDIADAIAAYEQSRDVSPFSSKYDAWRAGRASLTESELNGLRMATGTWTGRPNGAAYRLNAHCAECHMVASVPSAGPDLWTSTCYQNVGVPRNEGNPYYTQTDQGSNPAGYNPLGRAFIDYGLGAFMYSALGLPPGNVGPGSNGMGDFLGFNGMFKAPSLRNVDKRPYPGFVKAYMHNGALKSLEDVVHFYNTRNLTTRPGEVIDFSLEHPYAHLRGRPLWDPPEYPGDTLVNPSGILGTLPGTGPGGETEAQVGNLGLTRSEERDIVAFLGTLSDGYFDPATLGTCAITSQPVSQKSCIGGSVTFTVASNAEGPLSYQWRRDGQPIEGETLSYYTITAVAPRDAGAYDCVVTAGCGAVTSVRADLDVCPADFNCDGATDRSDFSAFFDAVVNDDPEADRNGDGVVDQADVSVFLEAFRAGC